MEIIVKSLEKKTETKEVHKDIEQKKNDDTLFLIHANESHCNLVYEWINDDEVRKNSFNTNKIKYEEHVNWYREKINSDNCKMYLLADSNNNIGIVRLEKKNDEKIISYSISKEYRGKGYGYKILLEFEKELIKLYKKVKVIAYVKKENIASIRIFTSLKYKIIKEDYEKIKFEKIISRRDFNEKC